MIFALGSMERLLVGGAGSDMPYIPNPGHVPEECAIRDPQTGEVTGWHKAHVRLFNGWCSKRAGHDPWPASGARIPTDWRIRKPPHPFDIQEFEIA